MAPRRIAGILVTTGLVVLAVIGWMTTRRRPSPPVERRVERAATAPSRAAPATAPATAPSTAPATPATWPAPPGSYVLVTGTDGAWVDLTGGDAPPVPFRPRLVLERTIRGRVVAEDGRPAPGAIVLGGLHLATDAAVRLAGDDGVHAGDDGTFELRARAGERVYLVALTPVGWSEAVSVPPGRDDAAVELRLRAAAGLRGVVRYAGRAATASVWLRQGDRAGVALGVITGDDGTYQLLPIAPGIYAAEVALLEDVGGARPVVRTELVVEPGRLAVRDFDLASPPATPPPR